MVLGHQPLKGVCAAGQRIKLTGAAILVSRGTTPLQRPRSLSLSFAGFIFCLVNGYPSDEVSVKTLAEVVVFLMEVLTTTDGAGIDDQSCGDITNDMWFELAKSSPIERQALAEAAARRLKEL